MLHKINNLTREILMMAQRLIPVSTDLYAAIWKVQQPGEVSEEEILRRVLHVPLPIAPPGPAVAPKIGFRDPRFGLELPEGFEIFRTYQGVEYRAKAVNGGWMLMSTGDMYPSFNRLSIAIGTKGENAWNNWYFLAKDGKRRLVDELRDPSLGHGFTR
jgi:hypothetical protein